MQVIDTLLQSVLTSSASATAPATSAHPQQQLEARVSWDRIDSIGNALITYIALDSARFQVVAQYLVSQQQPSKQATLLQCLNRLTTARGVKMHAIDKPNRVIFVQNFREFVTQVKSLSLV